MEGSREDIQENRKVGDSRDSAGRAARSDTSRENVDEESPTSSREDADSPKKAEHNLNQKKTEKSEECESPGG